MEHRRAGSSSVAVVRQVWWKRVGVWLGGLFALQGIIHLLTSSVPTWFSVLMLCAGVCFIAVGWRQRVRVSEDGIETLRVARRTNRTASWAEVERFEPNKAVLRDGTTLPLFDWSGDGEAVRDQLEAERQARQ